MPTEIGGQEIALYVDLAGDGSNFVLVGSQRGATFEESNAEIDFSSKESRVEKIGYGRYSWTVTLSHLFVPDDQSFTRLAHAARYAEKVLIRRAVEGQQDEQALAMIATRSLDAPDQEASTVSVTLRAASQWSAV